MSDEKIRPKHFYFAKNPEQRLQEEAKLVRYLRQYPLDRFAKVVVTEGKEKRRDQQNALWWAWNAELVLAHDGSHENEYYHAHNKLYVLLPLMVHAWDRWREEGEFLEEAVNRQFSEGTRLKIADRLIRSSQLNVAEGSLYTSRLRRYWDQRGVELTVKASERKYRGYPEAHIA